MPELQEFRLTFGLRYGDEPHPSFPAANPNGWVAVTAEDYEAARALVVERIGNTWAFLYPVDKFQASYHPAGETARWSTAETSPVPTGVDALDLTNAQLVGVLGGKVLVSLPQLRPITPAQALVHAAWLVVIASSLDPTLPPFGEVLEAVRNT